MAEKDFSKYDPMYVIAADVFRIEPPQARVNLAIDTMAHVQLKIARAISEALKNCRDVDPTCNVVFEEFEPATDLSRWGEVVSVNKYRDDWHVVASPPADTSTPVTALAARLKTDSIIVPIGAVAVAPAAGATMPVRKVTFYKDINRQQPLTSVDFSKAVSPQDYPWHYVALPKPIIWRPGTELAVDIYLDGGYIASIPSGGSVDVYVSLLPAVKLIKAKSSKYQALY